MQGYDNHLKLAGRLNYNKGSPHRVQSVGRCMSKHDQQGNAIECCALRLLEVLRQSTYSLDQMPNRYTVVQFLGFCVHSAGIRVPDQCHYRLPATRDRVSNATKPLPLYF